MSDHSQTEPEAILLDDPEMGSTWFITIASVIIFAVTVLALSMMYFDFEESEVEVKMVNAPVEAFQSMRLAQQELLTETSTYSVEDADGNKIDRIRIPISRAMDAVIADAKARASLDSEEALATR